MAVLALMVSLGGEFIKVFAEEARQLGHAFIPERPDQMEQGKDQEGAGDRGRDPVLRHLPADRATRAIRPRSWSVSGPSTATCRTGRCTT